jgi:hypothetical protein
MTQTKVVHCKKEKYDIYIGRPSIFGNPFTIGKDGTRKEVIDKYRIYFTRQIDTNIIFKREVQKLNGKILGCWCKPKNCHGDIIAEYLNDNQKPTT